MYTLMTKMGTCATSDENVPPASHSTTAMKIPRKVSHAIITRNAVDAHTRRYTAASTLRGRGGGGRGA